MKGGQRGNRVLASRRAWTKRKSIKPAIDPNASQHGLVSACTPPGTTLIVFACAGAGAGLIVEHGTRQDRIECLDQAECPIK